MPPYQSGDAHPGGESTKVHHITDDDVRDCPTFRQVAKSLADIFEGCDVAGYNSNKFDVPMLIEEFARAGIKASTWPDAASLTCRIFSTRWSSAHW